MPRGTSCPPTARTLFARYMEVYAAMVDRRRPERRRGCTPRSTSWRARQHDLRLPLRQRRLPRGRGSGTQPYFRRAPAYHGGAGTSRTRPDRAQLDLIGGPRTLPHYPRGWAMASNTPFRLYKINTHAGGHSVPFIVSLADRRRPTEVGGLRRAVRPRHRRAADAARADRRRPRRPTGTASPLQPLAGSQLRCRSLADADAPSTHTRAVLRDDGHRGYYRDGWEIVTRHRPLTPFGDHEWELYDLRRRPDRDPRPGRRAPGAGRRAGRGLGARGAGEPGVPARRGVRIAALPAPRARGRVRARRSASCPGPTRSSATGRRC